MTNELKQAIDTVKSYLDMDSDVDSEYLNAQRTIINALETQPTDKCKGCYYNDGETHAECVVCDKEAQPTSDDEIIKALKAVRTIHNGNYAPQIDEAIRRLEAPPTDAEREAYIKGYDYGVKDWFKSKTQPCDDCVSRKDAVRIASINSMSVEECVKMIKKLPSVTPQRPKGKWIEIEIDAGEFINVQNVE